LRSTPCTSSGYGPESLSTGDLLDQDLCSCEPCVHVAPGSRWLPRWAVARSARRRLLDLQWSPGYQFGTEHFEFHQQQLTIGQY
jgi:hypothetical protein